ncbi:hypothetical protein [Nocardioides alcanivorans]|uniref:hypothetical protein n=1 Tax=Nocardioides alcanivorans TaxID=2897352 RepID=UPI001F471282|nr:hypothetical protein [Nocardioides alcanivorans]
MQPQPPEHSLPEDSGFDPRFEGEDLELCRELLPRAREVVEDPVVRAAVAELVSELADSPHVRGIARERVVAYVDGVAVMKAMSSLANRESVPQLLRSPYPFGRAGLDNPDNVYRTARLDGSLGYVLEGERNSSYDLYLQLMDGQPGKATACTRHWGCSAATTSTSIRRDASG